MQNLTTTRRNYIQRYYYSDIIIHHYCYYYYYDYDCEHSTIFIYFWVAFKKRQMTIWTTSFLLCSNAQQLNIMLNAYNAYCTLIRLKMEILINFRCLFVFMYVHEKEMKKAYFKLKFIFKKKKTKKKKLVCRMINFHDSLTHKCV